MIQHYPNIESIGRFELGPMITWGGEVSPIERIIQFAAGLIGIAVFCAGAANAYLADQSITTAASEAIGDINISQRLADNFLVKLVVFSLLDMSLAFVAAFLVLCARSYSSVFAIVLVPAVLAGSYLSSVMLMDIVFYGGTLGAKLGQLEGWVVFGAMGLVWPMALSTFYEIVVFVKHDRELGSLEYVKANPSLEGISSHRKTQLAESAQRSFGRHFPGLKSCFGLEYSDGAIPIALVLVLHLVICGLALWSY